MAALLIAQIASILTDDPNDWPALLNTWCSTLDDEVNLGNHHYALRPSKASNERRFYGIDLTPLPLSFGHERPTSVLERRAARDVPLVFPVGVPAPLVNTAAPLALTDPSCPVLDRPKSCIRGQASPIRPCFYLGDLVSRASHAGPFHTTDNIIVVLVSSHEPPEIAIVTDFVRGRCRLSNPSFRLYHLPVLDFSKVAGDPGGVSSMPEPCASGFRFGWLSNMIIIDNTPIERIASTFSYEDDIDEELFHDLLESEDICAAEERALRLCVDRPGKFQNSLLREYLVVSVLARHPFMFEQFYHRRSYGRGWFDPPGTPVLDAIEHISATSTNRALKRMRDYRSSEDISLRLILGDNLRACSLRRAPLSESWYWPELDRHTVGEFNDDSNLLVDIGGHEDDALALQTCDEGEPDFLIHPVGRLKGFVARSDCGQGEPEVFWDLTRGKLGVFTEYHQVSDDYSPDGYVHPTKRISRILGPRMSIALFDRHEGFRDTFTLSEVVTKSGFRFLPAQRIDGVLQIRYPPDESSWRDKANAHEGFCPSDAESYEQDSIPEDDPHDKEPSDGVIEDEE